MFNKIDVSMFQEYMTKYPNGKTIFESLSQTLTSFNTYVDEINGKFGTLPEQMKALFDSSVLTVDQLKVLEEYYTSQSAVLESTYLPRLSGVESQLAERATIAQLTEVAKPIAKSLVVEFTDTSRVYVYTGVEIGYTAGHWYFYNGATWVSGGIYQSVGIADKSITAEKTDFFALDSILSKSTIIHGKRFDVVGGIYSLVDDASAFIVAMPKSIMRDNKIALMHWDNSLFYYNSAKRLYLLNSSFGYVLNSGRQEINQKWLDGLEPTYTFEYVALDFNTTPNIKTIGLNKMYDRLSETIYKNVTEKTGNKVFEIGNAYYDASPNIIYSANYMCTNIFPTIINDVIHSNLLALGATNVYALFFDANGKYVGRSGLIASFPYTATIATAVYACFVWSKLDTITVDNLYMSVNENMDYKPYEVLKSKMIASGNISWYSNKIVATLGDSITNLNRYQPIVISKLVLGAHTKLGVDGSRVAYRSALGAGDATNLVAMCTDDRVNTIPLTTQLLIFMGGTNDFSQNIPLGECSLLNTDTDTYYGALNVMFSKITARVPNALIIAMSCILGRVTDLRFTDQTGYKNNAGNSTLDYGKANLEMGRLWGCKCIDLGMVGINKNNLMTKTADGFHPTIETGQEIGLYITKMMQNFEPMTV